MDPSGSHQLHRKSIWDKGLDSPPLIFLLLGVSILLLLLSPYLYPIIIALIFVMAGMKTKKILESMSKKRKRAIITSLYFIFILFVALVIYCAGYISENFDYFSKAHLLEELQRKTFSILEPLRNGIVSTLSGWTARPQLNMMIDARIQDGMSKLGGLLTSGMLIVLTTLPFILFNIVVCFLAIMVFKRKYHELRFYTLVYAPSTNSQKTLKTVWDLMESSAYTAMVSTLAVSLVQGLILCCGAYVCRLEAWPVYFLAGFVCSFVPVIGLLPVIVLGFIHCFFLHGLPTALIFLVFSGIAAVMDNILLSLFMAEKKSHLSNLLNFFCLISALYIFGAAGIVLGPFLVSLSQGLRRHAFLDLNELKTDQIHSPNASSEENIKNKLRSLGFSNLDETGL